MATHLELDILDCEVKKALESIIMNKASGGDGIPAELFEIVKYDDVKEKVKEFQKNISFCFIDYAKAFDCVGHNKLWKILKEMGIPDHLTCLLRNLYVGQEATKLDMEQGLVQNWERSVTGYILSPC